MSARSCYVRNKVWLIQSAEVACKLAAFEASASIVEQTPARFTFNPVNRAETLLFFSCRPFLSGGTAALQVWCMLSAAAAVHLLPYRTRFFQSLTE